MCRREELQRRCRGLCLHGAPLRPPYFRCCLRLLVRTQFQRSCIGCKNTRWFLAASLRYMIVMRSLRISIAPSSEIRPFRCHAGLYKARPPLCGGSWNMFSASSCRQGKYCCSYATPCKTGSQRAIREPNANVDDSVANLSRFLLFSTEDTTRFLKQSAAFVRHGP